MADILITPKTKTTVFSGNLMKAPPLNRRGRKKWHERYFVLRSNKTLECYKSRKAAESSKTPRRIIDLRECISLEIGLEYKHLQHILSLGTFKRTFFLGAPSDALMLQWAHVLEKVKNAQDGETIELLDIGLRHSKDHNAVHRVKPSASTHRFSVTSPSKTLYGSGASKSTMTLLHYIRDSAETINLRGSQDSSVELSPAPPQRPSSFAVHNGISFVGSNPPAVSSPDRSQAMASVPLAIKTVSISEREKDTTHKRAVSIGSPQDIQVAASSFLPPEHLPSKVPPPSLAAKSATSPKEWDETDQGGVVENKLFVVKSAGLQRKKAMKSSSPLSKQKQSPKSDRKLLEPPVVPEVGRPGHDNSTLLRSNMTRSFRYRKITLRHEKPLFVNKQDGADSSDEEGENENGGANGTINEEDVTKVGPNFAVEQSSTSGISTRRNPSAGSNSPRVLCKVKANQGYSKVKLGGLKSPKALSENGSKSASISEPKLSLVESVPEDKDGENQPTEERVIPSPLSPDVFELPARPPSDSFLYHSETSLNSLDNILVDPPAMFDSGDKGERDDTSSELRRSNEQTNNPNSTADRNSTESNDTGYTSSASPGYHDRHKLSVTDEYDEDCELPEIRDTFQQASQTEQSQTSTLSSASTDNIRQYVPLVFFCPRVGKDASLFAVQVCLVENSDELVKDLISLKSLESYRLVECEELQGSNVSTFGDDFTVATALEDLEFGFSVVTSTQKDLFLRKVRQFQFEIRDLFGCSDKPFSCDVEIRYADQMTVLPIEVQRSQD